MCNEFCTSNADCAAPGGLCLIQLSNGNGGSIPNVTLCTTNCNPLTNAGCAPGTGCQLLQETMAPMAPLTDCRGVGTKTHLVACNPMLDECAPKFGCLNIGTAQQPDNVCLQYCNTASPVCPGGQGCFSLGVSLGGVAYGVCE
jgi:hypothetical protein